LPLIRKIIEVGKSSRGVILPKSWLEYCEKEFDQKMKKVTIEVDDSLMIKPFFEKIEEVKKRNGQNK